MNNNGKNIIIVNQRIIFSFKISIDVLTKTTFMGDFLTYASFIPDFFFLIFNQKVYSAVTTENVIIYYCYVRMTSKEFILFKTDESSRFHYCKQLKQNNSLVIRQWGFRTWHRSNYKLHLSSQLLSSWQDHWQLGAHLMSETPGVLTWGRSPCKQWAHLGDLSLLFENPQIIFKNLFFQTAK